VNGDECHGGGERHDKDKLGRVHGAASMLSIHAAMLSMFHNFLPLSFPRSRMDTARIFPSAWAR
jgi:hypothetical protein